MSYDTYIKHGTIEKDLGNYTYNCGGMLAKGMGGNTLSDLSGMKCREAAVLLRQGYEYMRDNPRQMEEMNPSNGWGNYKSWLEYIHNILIECEANPDATLEVC